MSQTETFIHPTAIVEKGAELGVGVHIGPYAIVGPHVKLGDGCWVQSHALISGHTSMGEKNEIFAFASVGNVPQDLKHKGEITTLEIGRENKIREYCTLQPGTVNGGGKTVIGDGNLLMAYTHVAHDCFLGNKNIMANGAQLAGHVTIHNEAIVSSLAGVHQFCRIGDNSLIAAGAMVAQDVPPFVLVQGDRATVRGLNVVGLKRKGFTAEKLRALKNAYRIMFLTGAPTVDGALEECRKQGLLEHSEIVSFVEFIKSSKRGVSRPAQDVDNPENE